MTPKEFEFWFHVVEQAAQMSYQKGVEDGKSGADERQFTLTREHRLTIKTALQKFLKKT